MLLNLKRYYVYSFLRLFFLCSVIYNVIGICLFTSINKFWSCPLSENTFPGFYQSSKPPVNNTEILFHILFVPFILYSSYLFSYVSTLLRLLKGWKEDLHWWRAAESWAMKNGLSLVCDLGHCALSDVSDNSSN